MSQSAGSERGFTLVEVLTALAIAAVAIVALYRGVTQSTQATAALDNRFAATLLARSLMDDALQNAVTSGLRRDGTEGALSWQVRAETPEPQVAAQAPRGMALYTVTVTVNWAPRGELKLSALALGR